MSAPLRGLLYTCAIAAVFLLLLSACSDPKKTRPKIGVAMRSFDDPYSSALRRAIETEAVDKAELAVIDGQNQQSAQNLQVDSFFERKLAAIAVDPIDAKAMTDIVAKAKAKQIPVVFFDRLPSEEALRSWDKVFFVGVREADAGAAQGELLAEYWKAEPQADRNKDKAVQYVWLEDEEGSSPRAEGFAKAMSAAGIKVEKLASGFDPAIALKLGDKVEAVVCADLASTLGMVDQLKAKGKKGVAVVGAGAGEPSAALVEALKSHLIVGAAAADSESLGRATLDLANALARTEDPAKAGLSITDAKYVWIPCRKYTPPVAMPGAAAAQGATGQATTAQSAPGSTK
jgi:ABC-type sugar transport system, periplasmic component